MANNKIQARKESLILRELTLILNRQMEDELLKAISISEVRLTNDSELAKVYFSFIAFNEDITLDAIEDQLELRHGKIRKLLASKIQMRAVPELQFIYDTSLDNANRIEEILKKVNKG
ncbi:30S ribosome-binding factor RbfA [Mesoplasma photuris]|uniref:30S ribosome-binding factor RbfA n=1 Tax=Mesoplasma photuris TaxID=217731 RepID=UPI0004E206C8|nr:30S ribosome-binding factor RbfA [Mesoplasma photuris]